MTVQDGQRNAAATNANIDDYLPAPAVRVLARSLQRGGSATTYLITMTAHCHHRRTLCTHIQRWPSVLAHYIQSRSDETPLRWQASPMRSRFLQSMVFVALGLGAAHCGTPTLVGRWQRGIGEAGMAALAETITFAENGTLTGELMITRGAGTFDGCIDDYSYTGTWSSSTSEAGMRVLQYTRIGMGTRSTCLNRALNGPITINEAITATYVLTSSTLSLTEVRPDGALGANYEFNRR